MHWNSLANWDPLASGSGIIGFFVQRITESPGKRILEKILKIKMEKYFRPSPGENSIFLLLKS